MAKTPVSGTRIATKAKIAFIDLIRPEAMNHYMGGIDVQKAIETYRWMCHTAQGAGSHRTKWGQPYGNDAIALLDGQPTLVGTCETPKPFGPKWREELQKRFEYVLLSGIAQPAALKWKKENGIDIMSSRVIPIRYYTDGLPAYPFIQGGSIKKAIDNLFKLHGRKFNYSPNPSHLEAQIISQIKISVYPNYCLDLSYGYHASDYTTWAVSIPAKEDELLWDWANRAYREAISILEPEARHE